MEKLVVVGASSLVIIKLIDAINRKQEKFQVHGFLDDADEMQGRKFYGIPVLGKINNETVSEYSQDALFIDNVYGGNIETRIEVSKRLDEFGIKYANLIHPSVDMNYVTIGSDCIVYQGVTISTDVEISDHAIISQGVRIGHECKIGKYCFMSPGSILAGRVNLCSGVTLGCGAIVIGDLEIGAMSFVGAGSVVLQDVPENVTVFGNPARIIKRGTGNRRAL